ncbi:MAG: hypothetical protein ABIU87_08320 [Ornithinibacter sp.]
MTPAHLSKITRPNTPPQHPTDCPTATPEAPPGPGKGDWSARSREGFRRPDPRTGAPVRERAYGIVLPVGGVLAVVVAIWMVAALRRSRRNGERFLPMLSFIPN